MKAFVTVIDDDGTIICKDQVLKPIRQEVIVDPYQPPIKEVRFNFAMRQLAGMPLQEPYKEVENADSN